MLAPKKRILQIRSFILFFFGFFLLLLLLFFIYHFMQFRAVQTALRESEKERLISLGESVRLLLYDRNGSRRPLFIDPVKETADRLDRIMGQKKVGQIVVVGPDGAVLADSQQEVGQGGTTRMDMTKHPWSAASKGEVVVEMSSQGIVWVPFEDAGMKSGVIRVTAPLLGAGNPEKGAFFLFIKFFGTLGAGVFLYYLFRFFVVPRRSDPNEIENAQAETNFVIGTFQNLIQQLKQKELELERLKGVAEERAKRVESYNENILQSVTSGVLTFNRERKITTFNAAAGAILNLSTEQAMGKSLEDVFRKNKKITQLLEETLFQEKEGNRQECEVEKGDGGKIWLGMNTSVLRDRNNETIGATLVFTDLTEMKMLQDQIELKKRLAVMGEMSAWVAHEFRNYMGTILGFSKLLSKRIDAADPKQQMIQAITNELSAMERLITELLAYGKRTAINPVPVSLTSVLQDLKEQFIATGAYSQIRWRIFFPRGLTEIELDPVLIRQAFSNLIQNALEAMKGKGEIGIDISTRPEGTVQVKISDSGQGISKENVEKIFLPFFTTKEKGTGLGLALVHKIILSHSGQISVESTEGKGTVFTVALPVHLQTLQSGGTSVFLDRKGV